MKSLLLTLTLLALVGLTPAQAAAPLNDNIASGTRLTGNYQKLTGQNLTQATAHAMDPMINGASAGKTLWYLVPAPSTIGVATLDVRCTSGSVTASLFAVGDLDNLAGTLKSESAATQIVQGSETRFNYSFLSGSAYMVALMVSGTGQFEVTSRMADYYARNDFPTTATVLTGERGTAEGNTAHGTVSTDEPAKQAGTPTKLNTVWYKWTPTFTGTAGVDTSFSFHTSGDAATPNNPSSVHDTVISLYSGTSPDSLSHLFTNNDSGWRTNSRITFSAVQGTTYYISVGTNAEIDSGAPGITFTGTPGKFSLQYFRANTAGEIYLPDFNLVGVIEGALKVPVLALRRYAGTGVAGCTLANVAGSSATSGSDFTALSATLSFPAPGADSDTAWAIGADLSILNDSTVESSEQINLAISSPTGGATLDSSYSTTRVFVHDDDSLQDVIIDVPNDVIRVKESQDWLNVFVQRSGDMSTSFDLMQSTSSGTAKWIHDFDLSQSGSIFAGESGSTVYFSITDDNLFEPEEEFNAYVQGGGGFTSYKVIIEDDDPFHPQAGRLTAAVSYAGGARLAQIYATIAESGAVTGKATLMGQTVPFTGTLDLRGKMAVRLAPKGRAALTLTLQAQNAEGSFEIVLQDSTTSFNNKSNAYTDITTFSTKLNPCPLAGLYTLDFGSAGMGVSMAGAASLKVDGAGIAQITGRLFDGTAFTTTGYIDSTARISCSAGLFQGLGGLGISGWLPTSQGSVANLTTRLTRPARSNDPTKLGGLTAYLTTNVCRYTPPGKNEPLLDAWQAGNAKAVLMGGPLMNTLTKALTITTAGKVTAPADAEKLKLTLVPATGVFTGTFTPPGQTKSLTIFGTLRDLPAMNGTGQGFFFNGLKGGQIMLAAP